MGTVKENLLYVFQSVGIHSYVELKIAMMEIQNLKPVLIVKVQPIVTPVWYVVLAVNMKLELAHLVEMVSYKLYLKSVMMGIMIMRMAARQPVKEK